MFKSELWQSHDEYRTLLDLIGKRLSRNDSKYHFSSYEDEYLKLYNLNLDLIFQPILKCYSHTGRPAKNQAQILRSFILFSLLANKTKAGLSLTKWVNIVLPNDPSLQALIGCSDSASLPPLGSYYDFINRFWKGSLDIYSRTYTYSKNKNGKKPKKQLGPDGKLIDETSNTTVKQLIDNISNGIPTSDNPEKYLQMIFYLLAVLPSAELGLINNHELTISGDGTAVISHSCHRGHHLNIEYGTEEEYNNADRHFPDPDAEWGWDSDKKVYYFGHTLYLFATYNREQKIDLPLLFNYTSAKRHDSLNFVYAFDDFLKHYDSVKPKNICLDSAHDNYATYELLDSLNINALIDLNGRSTSSDAIPEDISFDKDGHPLCQAGHKMVPWGNDPVKNAHKYRCPLKCERIDCCECLESCSKSKYGRTVYINNNADLRFQTNIPRDSEAYKNIYKERTACERLNNRILNDYHLQEMKIRGKHRFSFWTMIIGICIHLDARYKASLSK